MNRLIATGVAALAIIASLYGSVYVIDEGERGLLVTQGKLDPIPVGPGFHFKAPFFTTVHQLSIRTQVQTYEGLQAYTRDQQVATSERISVNYRIPENALLDVYTDYGSPSVVVEQFVGRRINEELEKVFGQYSAEKAVQNRAEISAALTTAMRSFTGPLEVVSVQLEDFSFPDEYEANINARMAAEVEAVKAKQTAIKTVTEAQAKADSQVALAKAQAEATKMAGDAEAAAIRAKGEALRDNPSLIELTAAERWNGTLPTTMVPGGATPFVNVGR